MEPTRKRSISAGKRKGKRKSIKIMKLPKEAKWGIKEVNIFNKYLKRYTTLPRYKKLLNSMIKFENMYQPISKGVMMVDPFNYIYSANEAREIKRAQVYMNKRDLIDSMDTKEGRKIVITSKGHKIFYRDYPLAKLRRNRWDGYWTVIIYDFPETINTTRKRIRRRLIDLGCGTPQISILATPLDLSKPIHQLIEGEKIEKYLWTFRAKKILGMTNRDIALKSWALEDLNHLYSLLLKSLTIVKNKKELLEEWKMYFLAVNSTDPYLPHELLPKNWLGTKCEKQFKNLSSEGIFHTILNVFKKY